MTSSRALVLSGLISATFAVTLVAGSAFADPAKDPRVELASKIPGAKPEELRPSPIPGIYELARGADVAYVSSDGKYAIAGDLYDIASNDNLTEQRRREARKRLISRVPEGEMVVFSPKEPRYTITVFTDIDCSYCRKLHSEIGEYNRLGIRVRYMFYPRTGPGTESWDKANEVWCSANRNDALTRAKRGEPLKAPKSCSGSPVAKHYELGQEIALQGTPAIVMASGEMLPGYLPPALLAQHLSETSAQKK